MSMIYVKKHGASGQGEGFTPSSFVWGLEDVDAPDSGRTDDADMHRNRVARKRKLQIGFNGKSRAETARILQAFQYEYIDVTYPDALTGTDLTKIFYSGDQQAPVKVWNVNSKIYASISFNIVER